MDLVTSAPPVLLKINHSLETTKAEYGGTAAIPAEPAWRRRGRRHRTPGAALLPRSEARAACSHAPRHTSPAATHRGAGRRGPTRKERCRGKAGGAHSGARHRSEARW